MIEKIWKEEIFPNRSEEGESRSNNVPKLLGPKSSQNTVSKAITHCGENNRKLSVKVEAGKVYFRPSAFSQKNAGKDERMWI